MASATDISTAQQLEASIEPVAESGITLEAATDTKMPGVKVKEELYNTEKEKRLADFVAHAEATRKTAGAEGFKRSQNIKIKGIITDLLVDGQNIEQEIVGGENEIFYKNEVAFHASLDAQEVSNLKARQAKEVKAMKGMQELKVQELIKQSGQQKFQREQQRELKTLFEKTHNQESAYRKTEEVKQALYDHRERSERIVEQMEERHQKQIKQFVAAEERKIADQRILMELEVRHLSEDQKAEAMKEYYSKMNHQKSVDKRRLDQIRDQQRLELRHYKDLSDAESIMIDEYATIRSKQEFDQQTLLAYQRMEYVNEKERMASAEEALKVMEIQGENSIEVKKLINAHRAEVRKLQKSQRIRRDKRDRRWSVILGRDVTALKKFGSGSSSAQKSRSESQSMSRCESDQGQQQNISSLFGETTEKEEDNFLGIENEVHAKDQIAQMQQQLKNLVTKHEKAFAELQARHASEFKEKETEFAKELLELEWSQDVELKEAKQADEDSLAEALQVQERELAMEGHIRGAETRALQERRVLNSLLDSVVDGVISIDPRGFIVKFNVAAEKQFGFSAAEIIGRNVKELMPVRFSKNHDDCMLLNIINLPIVLYNYLSTGIKKVIGSGRDVTAMHRNGSEFPINLSISEVIEDGFHLFTAIVRDLTKEFEAAKLKQAEDDCLPQMIWKIDNNGDAYFLNKRFLNYVGLTEDQITRTNVFDSSVVHPEDCNSSKLAFASAKSSKTTFETKRRLLGTDGNYRWFLTRGSPIFNEDNEVKFWCGSCTDIDETERIQSELDTLPESIPQMLWKIDLKGDVMYSNTKFQTYIGISKNTKGANVFSPKIVHAEDLVKSKTAFEDAIRSESSFSVERRLKGVDGKYHWFNTRANPMFDEDGKLTHFYGTCMDIGEEKELEREMTILPESLSQMVWKSDVNGDVLYANSKFKNYIGAEEGKVLNVFSDKIVHKDDVKHSYTAFKKALKEKTSFEAKSRLLSAGGYYKRFTTRGVPLFDSQGEIKFFYGTCEDNDA